jgi:hypothetical protein
MLMTDAMMMMMMIMIEANCRIEFKAQYKTKYDLLKYCNLRIVLLFENALICLILLATFLRSFEFFNVVKAFYILAFGRLN